MALGVILGCGPGSDATAPTITSFTPTSGVYNTQVVVTGSGFTNGPKNFYFGGAGVTSGSSVINSDTKATIYVPADAVTGQISVTTTAGTGSSPSNFIVTPTFGSYSPNSGSAGTTMVTVTGYGLEGVNSIALVGPTPSSSSNPVNFAQPSATQITFYIPSGTASGSYSIIIMPNTAIYGSTPVADLPFTVN